jgi:hypothetical protein
MPRRNTYWRTQLDRTHPGAATSLREGMAEILTILCLGVPPTVARTLHSTNPIVVNDRDLPGALQERQAVAAGRADGLALVRRRDARSRSPVPPRQRPDDHRGRHEVLRDSGQPSCGRRDTARAHALLVTSALRRV